MDLFLVKHSILFPIKFGKLDLSISNFSLSVFLLPLFLVGVLMILMRKTSYFPKGAQNAIEFFYEIFVKIFEGHLGQKGKKYIPFLFSLMCFIFILNIGNLIPGFFACTSQLALTLTLGIIVFLLIVAIGFYEYGALKFFEFFIPSGIPTILKPFLFVLELFSFCIRPVSLALRLAINMLAGHAMLHVIASFASTIGVVSVLSIAISSILSIFEVCVAGLQAYVFAVLSCIYISDILQWHDS